MNLVAQFDSSTDAAPAWYRPVVQAVLGLMGSLFNNDLTVTLAFGWGEENGAPVDGDSAAANQSFGFMEDYATLRQGLTNSPAKVAQLAAAAMPAHDPTGGGQFFVSIPMLKSMGLANPTTTEVDGYVGVNAGLDWSTNQNSVAPDQHDVIGALEHEVTEVLGRIGGASYAFGPGVYGPLDLFRFSGTDQRNPSDDTGSFSVLGNRMLQPFNDPTDGGDAGDWSGAVQGDSFGDSDAGSATPMTAVDLTVMRALGYQTSSTASVPPLAVTGAASASSAVGQASAARAAGSADAAPSSALQVQQSAASEGHPYALLMGDGQRTFVFSEHPGQTALSDFVVAGEAHDVLILPSAEFASLAGVLHATHMQAGDAVIAVSPTDSITLEGVTKAQLRAHPGDFSFHA